MTIIVATSNTCAIRPARRQPRFMTRSALGAAILLTTLPMVSTADTVFDLGQVDVLSAQSKTQNDPTATVVDAATMRDRNQLTLAQALSDVPGVTLSSGGQRNEDQVFIRGFDSTQTTLNIDGVPVYVPYDGNIDLSRFLTGDLSQVVVSKGLSSLMYGPNNMGGSINLVTKRPSQPLSGRVDAGFSAGKDGVFSRHLGAELASRPNDLFYIQGGVERLSSGNFPLSNAYQAVAAQPTGERLNAYAQTTNTNLRVGFTPNATDEYTLSYYGTSGDKGSPPYTGTVGVTRYWQWPEWNKNGFYYLGKTAIAGGMLKTQLYYDKFDNMLSSFDNASYTTQTKRYAFNSQYKDHSTGGGLQWDRSFGVHAITLMAQAKYDVHRERNLATGVQKYDSAWLQFKSHIYSVGAEDRIALSDQTHLTLSYRYDRSQITQAQEYANKAETAVRDMAVAGASGANNLQAVLTHDAFGQTFHVGVAHKTHFPTIKDIFSYRLGASIPNPALGAEAANTLDAGVRGQIFGSARYSATLFTSRITDAIEMVALTPTLGQNQNVGSAKNSGLELTFSTPLGESLALSSNYTYLARTLGASNLVATGTPRHSGFIDLSWFPLAKWTFDAELRGYSSRQTATNGLQPTSGYATLALRARYDVAKNWTLRAGINNLTDRNYQVTEGFPSMGRTVYGDVEARF
jgi:iron complex outermembrane receptor protein